jgi:hypothetical protein
MDIHRRHRVVKVGVTEGLLRRASKDAVDMVVRGEGMDMEVQVVKGDTIGIERC